MENQEHNVTKTNVFISWSNDVNSFGKQAAEMIYRFLYDQFSKDNDENLCVYYSPMSSGIWVPELFSALKKGDFGIFIVTPEFLDSTWCAVEFGAILVNNLQTHVIDEKEVIDFSGVGDFILPVCFYAGIDKTNSPFKEDQIKKYDSIDDEGDSVILSFLTKIIRSAFGFDSKKLTKMVTRLIKVFPNLKENLDDLTKKYENKGEYTRNYKLQLGESKTNQNLEHAQSEIDRLRNDLGKNNTPVVEGLKAQIVQLTEQNRRLTVSLEKAKSELEKQDQSSTQTSDSFEIVVEGKSYGNMIYVKGGSFSMGSNGKEAYDAEKCVHDVSVSDFLIGDVTVTQGLWNAVMHSNPSDFMEGEDYPVECVTWYDAINFCNELSKKMGFDPVYKIDDPMIGKDKNGNGEEYKYIKEASVNICREKNGFRLPTEAEWEYAARGGHKTDCNTKLQIMYSGDHNGRVRQLRTLGWYGLYDNVRTTMPVGYRLSNELGLYDMSGNVWEWCQDLYDEDFYKKCKVDAQPAKDPVNDKSGSARVLRGGSWSYDARCCRVSYRYDYRPDRKDVDISFRLSLSPQKEYTSATEQPKSTTGQVDKYVNRSNKETKPSRNDCLFVERVETIISDDVDEFLSNKKNLSDFEYQKL